MTASQTAASLALAQVNLILAEAQNQARNHARYTDSLRAIQKRTQDSVEEVNRLVNVAASEALTISERIVQLEAEVQKFIQFNRDLGNPV